MLPTASPALPAASAPRPRRLRPAAPQRLAGAASLLRLAAQSSQRLPSGPALHAWAERAALALRPSLVR